MKYLLIVALAATAFASCNNSPAANEQTDQTQSFIDSLKASVWADSVTHAVIANSLFDTANLASAPVKVIRPRLFTEEYSSYRNIKLTYKNVSGKAIQAIKFRWYGLDGFNDPADMGSTMAPGFREGFDDSGLRPRRTTVEAWDILSARGKKVVNAWPIEVAFTDGTKWEAE